MQGQTTDRSGIGEDRIREAFENAASGMAITDLEGCFRQTNLAYREIVDRSDEDLSRETILSITHAEDRDTCHQHLHQLVSGKKASFVLEKRYLRPDGSPVWVRNSFSLLKDGTGQPTHIILICNDITERRRAERMLMESEKLAVVGQLAASISHEINNPLEAVLNLLYLVREANSLDEARQFAAQAEEEVQRAAQIATQTLQFHKQQTKPTLTGMVSVIESVLLLFKGKLRLTGIQVRLEKFGEPAVICYSGEIRQVLANLIRNAIEAMPNAGTLRLRVKNATDWRSGTPGVRITVADTGQGMSAKTQAHIYDAFFTTKGPSGTGLGLWVSSGILEKHGGKIRVRSTDQVGRSGTVFTLLFPTGSAAESSAAAAEETASADD